MNENKIPSRKRKIKLLHPEAKLPYKKYLNDSGWDVYTPETTVIKANSMSKINLGLAVEVKPGQMMTVRSRSSTKLKGIMCADTTCDADYTGELFAFVYNTTDKPITIEKGQRIVQIVFTKLALHADMEEGELPKGERDLQCLGSTGA